MAIDLTDTYEPTDITKDMRLMHFNSIVNGAPYRLRAYISNKSHPFMTDVYNLAFGPPLAGNETGIDDKIKIRHDNLDKMLSTVLLFAYAYLTVNNSHYVGIDGSCNFRAALYFRKLKGNYASLNHHFPLIAGNKYYIRFKRFDKLVEGLTEEQIWEQIAIGIRDNIDYRDIKAIPETIESHTRITSIEDNYNYFTFRI